MEISWKKEYALSCEIRYTFCSGLELHCEFPSGRTSLHWGEMDHIMYINIPGENFTSEQVFLIFGETDLGDSVITNLFVVTKHISINSSRLKCLILCYWIPQNKDNCRFLINRFLSLKCFNTWSFRQWYLQHAIFTVTFILEIFIFVLDLEQGTSSPWIELRSYLLRSSEYY